MKMGYIEFLVLLIPLLICGFIAYKIIKKRTPEGGKVKIVPIILTMLGLLFLCVILIGVYDIIVLYSGF